MTDDRPDSLIAAPRPSVLLAIDTFAAAPYVHLHLESRRRFYPDVPVIIHDDGGTDTARLQALCVAYGVHLFSPRERVGPDRAPLSATLLAVQSARQLGLDLAVTMSYAFVPLLDWRPQLQRLAAEVQMPTFGGLDRDGALRTECLALHAASWAAGELEARMDRAVEFGPPGDGSAGAALLDMAGRARAGARSAANDRYESVFPREPEAGAFALWPWLGDGAAGRHSSFLWRGADTVRDFYRLALAYGLDYRYEDFLDPEVTPDRPESRGRVRRATGSAETSPRVMQTAPYEARVVTHERGDFAAITHSNVLLYMPHGFGDWVHFSRVLPLLDPTNRYHLARFGDDSTALMEDNAYAPPLYCGHNPPNCDDGGAFDIRHFGLEYKEIDGTARVLEMPLSLHRECRRLNIDTLFWTSLPDPWGSSPYPYHTKARVLLPHLVAPERLARMDLDAPLPSTIRLESAPWLTRWVEARLTAFGGFGARKLCLITRNGYTTIGKNWGHFYRDEDPRRPLREGQECRDFMRLMLRRDPDWMFLIMEDLLYRGDDTMRSQRLHAYSYAEIFGEIGNDAPPFGLVMKALVGLASLAVGIPAGPHHLCMVRDDLPVVGLWLDQMPCWYDEPKDNAVHLISRNVRDQGMHLRPGSVMDRPGPGHRARWLDTLGIPGAQVLSAVEALLP